MTPVNRRKFLKTASGGVGALAFGDPLLARRQTAANRNAEIVVVGAGAFGGWTALYLREMGFTVTLIDQYGPGNSRATSGGESRQIRAAYGEREIYTRWVLEAFGRWKARETEWGRKLFFETGQLSLTRGWTKELTDTRKVFDKLGVKYELLEHDDLARRYPQMNFESIDFAMYTPSTGVLKAREGCVAVAQAFEKKGGRLVTAKVALGQRASGHVAGRRAFDRLAGGSPDVRVCLRAMAAEGLPLGDGRQAPDAQARRCSSTARRPATSASPTRTFPPGQSTTPTVSRASRARGSRWSRPSSPSSSILTRRSTR